MTLAGEPLSLNFLSLLCGTNTAERFREEYADELHFAAVAGLVGVADGTYPAKKGAKKTLRTENARRKAVEETQKPYPDGFCVANAYLPQLGCFASLQCRNTDFTWLLAATLVAPLEGVDYWLSDGSLCYNGTPAHNEGCLGHELRHARPFEQVCRNAQKDRRTREIKLSSRNDYDEAASDRAAVLLTEYPAFWDEESETFTGLISTNATEGGNWRLKYGPRTPHVRCHRALARTTLLALYDSLHLSRNGQPEVSFAHRVGEFSYEDVMCQSIDRLAQSSRTIR